MLQVRSNLVRPVARLCACLALSLAVGCAADEGTVTSDSTESPRIDFADGASVVFQTGSRGVGIVATAGTDAVSPLDGVTLDEPTPGALYEALSGEPAPASLQAAGAAGGPVITGTCPSRADYCGLSQSWPQTIHSSSRVDRVVGNITVLSGSLRARVFSTRAGEDRLLKTVHVESGQTFPLDSSVPGAIDRHMRVIIDNVSLDATYDLWLDWRG